MIDQTVAAFIFIGILLGSIGISMISSSAYTVPPIPAGWIIGVIFIDVGGSALLTGGISVKLFKIQKKFWTMAFLFGGTMVGLGIRNLINNPLELPACPCLPGYYGKSCLPCPDCHPIFSEGCNDGGEGKANVHFEDMEGKPVLYVPKHSLDLIATNANVDGMVSIV